MQLTLVDDIGIARQITLVAFTIDTSIKPAELWNGVFKSDLGYRAANGMWMTTA